ncbi:MAG: hypothetical protein K6D37_09805 [Prevotella sp.]|nr:hypothetical protein [Prevotella sp.]
MKLSAYSNLEELRQRKQELRTQLDHDSDQIGQLWQGLFVRREDSTRGEFIASVISNSALAIDAFLMVRKLKKTHNTLFRIFKRKKNK